MNSELFLIDEGVALLMCYYEFFDILKKLFCCCHRCIRYYVMFDKNTYSFDNPVTLSFENVDFAKNRKNTEEEYDLDEVKEAINNRKNL